MERNKIIKGYRISLEVIKESSIPELKEMLVNSEIKKTYMLPDFTNDEELTKYAYKLKGVTEDTSRFVYGIYLEDRLIGFLNEVSKKDSEMEVGYFLDPAYWNKGYASEALMLAIKELFRIGIKTVKAAYFEGNNASARVMQKCGMTLTKEEEYIVYREVNHRCIYYRIDKDNLID